MCACDGWQRVALARAVYADADVYVLDDCMSAVDTTVAQCIFEEAIVKRLKGNNKTVIMSTHNLHIVPFADQILYLEVSLAEVKTAQLQMTCRLCSSSLLEKGNLVFVSLERR